MIPPKQFEKILVPTDAINFFCEREEEAKEPNDEEEFSLLGLGLGEANLMTVIWVNYEQTPEECLTISAAFANQWNEEYVVTMTFYEEERWLYDKLQYTGEVLDYAEILTHPLKAVRESASRSYRRTQDEADQS